MSYQTFDGASGERPMSAKPSELALADLVDSLAHLVQSRSMIGLGDHQELDKLIAELSDLIRGMIAPRAVTANGAP